LKTRCRSREAASGPKKRPPSIRYAGVNGGLAETAVFGKTSTESSRWRDAGRGPVAAKPPEPSELARGTDLAPPRARQASQDVGREVRTLDGSRVGLQRGKVFTDQAAEWSRRNTRVWAAAKRFASRHERGARQARHWVGLRRPGWKNKPSRSSAEKRRSEGPPRATSAAWNRWVLDRPRHRGRHGRTVRVRSGEAVTSSGANEARVLEIEAADGRNRSHASRVGHGQRRKARLESHTIAQASTEQPRWRGPWPKLEWKGVRGVSVFNSECRALRAAGESS